jgi:hypothetical protein
MKLAFDSWELFNYMNGMYAMPVDIIPTTKKEKLFLAIAIDEDDNYRPWVYECLYRFGNKILDNIFIEPGEEDYYGMDLDHYMDCIYDIKKDAMSWKKEGKNDMYYILRPSQFSVLYLMYFLYGNYRKLKQMKQLYNKMFRLKAKQSVVIVPNE